MPPRRCVWRPMRCAYWATSAGSVTTRRTWTVTVDWSPKVQPPAAGDVHHQPVVVDRWHLAPRLYDRARRSTEATRSTSSRGLNGLVM
jgi:hypothetical protein